jgi:hypothetical protein
MQAGVGALDGGGVAAGSRIVVADPPPLQTTNSKPAPSHTSDEDQVSATLPLDLILTANTHSFLFFYYFFFFLVVTLLKNRKPVETITRQVNTFFFFVFLNSFSLFNSSLFSSLFCLELKENADICTSNPLIYTTN